MDILTVATVGIADMEVNRRQDMILELYNIIVNAVVLKSL